MYVIMYEFGYIQRRCCRHQILAASSSYIVVLAICTVQTYYAHTFVPDCTLAGSAGRKLR